MELSDPPRQIDVTNLELFQHDSIFHGLNCDGHADRRGTIENVFIDVLDGMPQLPNTFDSCRTEELEVSTSGDKDGAVSMR